MKKKRDSGRNDLLRVKDIFIVYDNTTKWLA
jgi:hypothetical protein